MKKSLAIAGVVLIGTSLSACGGDGDGGADSQYCTDLKSATKTFDDLDSGDVSGLEGAFKTFHSLADESPDEVKADWKVLDDGITSVEKALSDAGIKFSDFAKIQSGELPEGVDPTKLQDVASSFTELSDEKFTDAGDAIQKHAKDVCDVTLK